MNDCVSFETLERMHRGELPPVEAAVLGAHLRQCERCRSVIDQETEHAALRRRLEAGPRTEAESLDEWTVRLPGLRRAGLQVVGVAEKPEVPRVSQPEAEQSG